MRCAAGERHAAVAGSAGEGGAVSGSPQELNRNAVWRQVGRLLTIVRERRGFSRAELARRAGVSADLLAAYEIGQERFPGLEALLRLSSALDVNPLEVVRRAERQVGVSMLEGVIPPDVAMETSPAELDREKDDLQSFIAAHGEQPKGRAR